MQILSMSSVVPKYGYTTEELVEAFPCSLPEMVKQNILNTGVRKRYLLNTFYTKLKPEVEAADEDFLDLCAQACNDALRKASLPMSEIDYLVATYDANPLLSPGLSYVLVPRLGLDKLVKHVNAQGVASTA